MSIKFNKEKVRNFWLSDEKINGYSSVVDHPLFKKCLEGGIEEIEQWKQYLSLSDEGRKLIGRPRVGLWCPWFQKFIVMTKDECYFIFSFFEHVS